MSVLFVHFAPTEQVHVGHVVADPLLGWRKRQGPVGVVMLAERAAQRHQSSPRNRSFRSPARFAFGRRPMVRCIASTRSVSPAVASIASELNPRTSEGRTWVALVEGRSAITASQSTTPANAKSVPREPQHDRTQMHLRWGARQKSCKEVHSPFIPSSRHLLAAYRGTR